MSIFDDILAKLSDTAKEEFKKATEGMHLLDNSKGEFVNKGKAEAEKREIESKLKEAQAQIAAQSEAVKKAEAAVGNIEELKAKFAETEASYKKQLADIETATRRERQTFIVKDKLHAAGCKDVEYALFKLNQKGALDKLEFKENGDVVGLTDHIKELQTESPAHWQAQEAKGTYVPGKPAMPDTPEAAIKDGMKALGLKTE